MNHRTLSYSIVVCLMAVLAIASDLRSQELKSYRSGGLNSVMLHHGQEIHQNHSQHHRHHLKNHYRHQQHYNTSKLYSLLAKSVTNNANQKFSYLKRTIYTGDSKKCLYACKNGGKCVRGKCICLIGFSGQMCGLDVNECQDKPCDQSCHNTFGSYFCTCRTGFQLQADRQSCKKLRLAFGNRNDDDEAFEARDLENEVNQMALTNRISALEKITEDGRIFDDGMNKKMAMTASTLQGLQQRLDNLEKHLQEQKYIHGRLDTQDMQMRKLDYIVNMMYKCRTNHPIFCSLNP